MSAEISEKCDRAAKCPVMRCEVPCKSSGWSWHVWRGRERIAVMRGRNFGKEYLLEVTSGEGGHCGIRAVWLVRNLEKSGVAVQNDFHGGADKLSLK